MGSCGMSYPDLQSYIQALDERGYLKRVSVKVDPVLEISAIADRMCKLEAAEKMEPPPSDPVHGRWGGHALLFENVKDADWPVAINLFGSYERIRMALGCGSLEELAQQVESLINPQVPSTLIDKMKKLPELVKLASYPPKGVRQGICQDVVQTDPVDLSRLPIIQCWPHDGMGGYAGKPSEIKEGSGQYITLGGIYSRDPDTGEDNVGMYRVQLHGKKTMAVHWHMHHDGARHYRKYATAKKPMPLAIVLGGDSVLPYAATCPLPPNVSELLFAGFLKGSAIECVSCKTIPLNVPANAEIVIEGWVDPREKIWEGPFGDHTGFYSAADLYPRFTATAITHRRQPVYPTTIVGCPPMEDYYFGKATERIFLPLLKMLVPDIIDYHLPMFGSFHNCAFVKIKKEYPYQARRVMHSIWGAGQMAYTKMIVVVDDYVDVHDEQAVLFHLCANTDFSRDLETVTGPLDILDHASVQYGGGGKLGIDATRKIPGEGQIRDWPDLLSMTEDIKQRVQQRWMEYGL